MNKRRRYLAKRRRAAKRWLDYWNIRLTAHEAEMVRDVVPY